MSEGLQVRSVDRDLTVGFGRCRITESWKHPRPGHELPEYTVHDDLYATALVVKSGAEPVAALVSLDMGVITTPPGREIRRRVSEKTGIPTEYIGFHCTHTHAAYSGYGVDPGVFGGFIAEAVSDASSAAKPVRVGQETARLIPKWSACWRAAMSNLDTS